MQLFLENLKAFFETVSGWVWGPVMLVLLVGTGVLLTVMLKGLQFSMLGYALKQAFMPQKTTDDGEDHEGDISHFAALMTALSATIGTGNIAGVATAVTLGGAGAVFWMWVIATLGGASAFIESTLAQIYKKQGPHHSYGGPAYYIQTALKQNWLATLFASVLILTYMGGFNLLASFNVADAFTQYSWANEWTPWIIGAILAILMAGWLIGSFLARRRYT